MAFRCQKCQTEIKLDASFESMSKSQAKLLVSKVPTPSLRTSVQPTKFIHPDRIEKYRQALMYGDDKASISEDYKSLEPVKPGELGQSFVYISDSEDVDTKYQDDDFRPCDNVGEQLPDFSKIKTLNQVFEILLANQDVGHPMCSECSDLLTENYKLKFDQSQKEKEYYRSFLKKLKDRESDSVDMEESLGDQLNTAASDLKRLELMEQDRLSELESLEARHHELNQQLDSLNTKLEISGKVQLDELFRLKNTLNLNLQEKQTKLDQAKALYQKHLNHLDELRKINIYKELFDILFEGDYGLINGFRLGYKVPWPECNVALGQIVRMLKFLKERLGIILEQYKLVPMGSKSYILKQQKSQSEPEFNPNTASFLQLYSSNEFTLGKLFNFNKLDVSMMALLDIIAQFEAQLMNTDNELSLPYKASLKNGTLGGKSIRVTSNGQWTDSCRYLLVNLNWVLSYASARQEE
ncbi:APG6-domain-containing protein [Metschnikowia bicuspidata var. bicuspidata NRRL YB-4993]|uniref:APG6-domain-containing protein n=1 Tax=Metschnikowia bicuspidata var. bicuspidata NRRL YB-4993 TaxID=869754 RepID=A0A1A0H4T8_9ASCO|nr:APG6-domain-containing protein [Metschnikowia bicuspidata var. bicuspidata NRRL YB-4993]OBA19051.1 APG6-domain-containing protein [Metschnikowia bicuspidata var. bicuspidata NRRL YB-4993]